MPGLLPQPYAGTRIAFRLVYPDIQGSNRPGAQGRYISRDIGSVIIGARTANEHNDKDDGDGATVAEALKQLNGDPDKTLTSQQRLYYPPVRDEGHTGLMGDVATLASGEVEEEEDTTTGDRTMIEDPAEESRQANGDGGKRHRSVSRAMGEEEEEAQVPEDRTVAGMGVDVEGVL
ncbi:mtDNA inheritance, partitioning of the mitochondrial organelle [Curvularia kusanoi]|uniref:MtDNA inheritance, partitioning of the mitochondrial organelle n=1 Tax=Curvularia kusanoi TaxID=90978 RepID=A0A9P4T7V5_CURKU|nr:mtDNA inheritance, partitioning of the mitochondrial organelle [Curvularia kusanoi]